MRIFHGFVCDFWEITSGLISDWDPRFWSRLGSAACLQKSGWHNSAKYSAIVFCNLTIMFAIMAIAGFFAFWQSLINVGEDFCTWWLRGSLNKRTRIELRLILQSAVVLTALFAMFLFLPGWWKMVPTLLTVGIAVFLGYLLLTLSLVGMNISDV